MDWESRTCLNYLGIALSDSSLNKDEAQSVNRLLTFERAFDPIEVQIRGLAGRLCGKAGGNRGRPDEAALRVKGIELNAEVGKQG